MKVSICIPTYNGAQFIEKCLESACAQTAGDIEVVVCDDNSNDDTYRLACSYSATDSRVRVFRNQSNKGLVENWNAVIGHANGRWIKLLFQDDLLYPDCVATLLQCAETTNAPFVACHRDFIFESPEAESGSMYHENARLIRSVFAREHLDPEHVARFAIERPGINFVGEPTSTMIHRDVFDEIGAFDPALAQRCDTEFWVRAGLHHGVSMVSRPLVAFRIHGGSTSSSNYALRQFADIWLDQLVILHHYLFDPMYAPLRDCARTMGQLDQLEFRFWEKAYYAHAFAVEARRNGESRIWEDWMRVNVAYPRVRRVPLTQHFRRAWRGRLGKLYTRTTRTP